MCQAPVLAWGAAEWRTRHPIMGRLSTHTAADPHARFAAQGPRLAMPLQDVPLSTPPSSKHTTFFLEAQ